MKHIKDISITLPGLENAEDFPRTKSAEDKKAPVKLSIHPEGIDYVFHEVSPDGICSASMGLAGQAREKDNS